jgi:molybdopterin-synthase adenylyltransferase
LQALNPHCQLHTIPHALAGAELAAQVAAHEVVVDCTDNFASRFALNAACVQAKVPLVSAAAIRLEAQMTVFDARNPASPCYHCLYEESDELDQSCTRNGVLAPLVGTMGSLQALECIKLICGFGTSLVGRLLILDASTLQWRELRLKKNPECPVCAH